MTQIQKFLSELNENELAYFAKFKLHTYMPKTQLEIKKHLSKKGINNLKIEELISTNKIKPLQNGKEQCPRCFTDKLNIQKVELTNFGNHTIIENNIEFYDSLNGEPKYKSQIICNVCGFWVNDPNGQKPNSFVEKTTNYLKAILRGVIKNI